MRSPRNGLLVLAAAAVATVAFPSSASADRPYAGATSQKNLAKLGQLCAGGPCYRRFGLEYPAADVTNIAYRWHAKCSDGKTRTFKAKLPGQYPVKNGRFFAKHLTKKHGVDGRDRVRGQFDGDRVKGTLNGRRIAYKASNLKSPPVKWECKKKGVRFNAGEVPG